MFKKVLAVAFASAFFVGSASAENPNKNKKEAAFGSESCFIGGGMCKLSRGKNPPNVPNYEKTGCFGDYCFWREKPKWKLNQEERERRKKEQPFEIVDLNEYGGGGSQGKNKNKSNDSNHQKPTNKPKQDKPSGGNVGNLGASLNGAIEGLNGLLKPKPDSSSGSGSAGGGSSGGGSGSAGGGSSGGGSGSAGGNQGRKTSGYIFEYVIDGRSQSNINPYSIKTIQGYTDNYCNQTFNSISADSVKKIAGVSVPSEHMGSVMTYSLSCSYVSGGQKDIVDYTDNSSQCKSTRYVKQDTGKGSFSVLCTAKHGNTDFGGASVGSLGGGDSSKSDSGSSSPSSAGGSSSASSGGRGGGAGGKSEPANSDTGTADGGKSDGGKSDGGNSDGNGQGKGDGEGEESGGNCKYIPDWLCTADADPNSLDFSGITEGIKEVEAGSAYEYDSRFSESGKCPEPASVSLSGFEIKISYDFVCQFMEKIRFVVLAAFAMISVFIVLKAID